MSVIKVAVKWQKSLFESVEIDTSQPPSLFKMQLFSLTGVPPERQKILVKGGMLKDESDWSKLKVKDGQRLMMMGTAGPLPPSSSNGGGGGGGGDQEMKDATNGSSGDKKLDHKDASSPASAQTSVVPCGLTNLGNTCYMNATMQCLRSIDELKSAVKAYNVANAIDTSSALLAEAKSLFTKMDLASSSVLSAKGGGRGGGGGFDDDAFDAEEEGDDGMYEERSVAPSQFLTILRMKFPQFAQKGAGGMYMQQDAEECYSQILQAFREKLDNESRDDQGKVIHELFGIELETKLVCEESKEEVKEHQKVMTFKCNISKEVNHLHDGFRLSLCEDREKHSPQLNRMALYKGVSRITKLPKYLSVQLVRFLYRRDTQQKAKILRRVGFPLQMLDVFEFCSDGLKKKLEVRRDVWQKKEDAKVEQLKQLKSSGNSNGKRTHSEATAAEAEGGDGGGPVPLDLDLDGEVAEAIGHTGFYDLHAIVTHKGRIADSGHYVGWVKTKDQWVEFDDDSVYPVLEEDIQKLDGGGDWHMAYLCIYKARLA